mgnify:FL=1
MLTNKELREIVDIGIALTTEKNKNRLLEMILKKAMDISNCDAGTLYLYTEEGLEFKIMKTLSQGVSKGENGEKIELPPVPLKEENVCAYSAIHNELINIEDVYHSERFDFSGPKKYDSITGYRTQSMIVIPMADAEGELVGVLQLMNSKDKEGHVVAFTEDAEFVLRSMGSQAAVSVSNMKYMEEIKKQLHSFVSAFATAVDERTPYNGSHTRKVAVYAVILADYINRMYEQGRCEEYFDDNRKDQLHLSAALHDIGKMIVPLSVMNKATRLDGGLVKIEERFKLLKAYYEIDFLKGRISREDFEEKAKYLEESLQFITEIDNAGFMPDDKLTRVAEIAAKVYEGEDGTKFPYLTEVEKDCLSIRRGTLTQAEREIMESHVVMTHKILNKVHFSKNYSKVNLFASTHHEALNGSGYPNHLTAENLELESRILAVVDVFDALTCTDRPYKKPMPKERAFAILHDMANKEGKLEDRLVTWLEEAMEEIDMDSIDGMNVL